MSGNILVIEYEPRYLEHVRAALEGGGYRLEISGNLDDAVNRCATFEPTVVIITSVLPNLKVEDAITQLRARAGLRATPILILMSGYQGESPAEDAVRYGAQDILQRPFGRDDLRTRVEKLVESAPNPAATQAIPQEMLEALRKSAGLDGDGQPVTSDDLFGDILSDVEGGERQPVAVSETPAEPRPAKPAEPAQPSRPPKAAKPAARSEMSDVDKALSGILDSSKPASSREVRREAEEAAEKMLSETLSGLEIEARAKKAVKKVESAKPKPTPAPEPPPVEPVQPPQEARAAAPTEQAPPQPTAQKPPSARVKPAPAEPAPPQDAQAPAPEPQRPPPEKEPSSEVPAVKGTQFGQYVIEEHIATGGMAEVYKARMVGMEGFQKTVAIKRILSNLTDSEEFVRMFIDEAKLAAQLNHNNIIHIYDLGKVDRSHYIAMEFIEGRDLRSILTDCRDRGRQMPIELALHVTMLLASALDYAHKKRDFENRELGLVHRDVSPQNVLISYEGDVKLCDFGIAKAASKATQTRAGALKGKLQYMSPEQAWGKNIDHRSDIFSLGLVLYEMLTSHKVFAGDSELSVLEQVRDPIIAAPSSHIPELDPEIDRIVFKALHADREERYQSALEMRSELGLVLKAHEWTPGRVSIAAFLGELDGRTPTADATPPEAAVSAPPPSEPPDGDEVFEMASTPVPPVAEPAIMGAPDPELERALGPDVEAAPTPLLDEFMEETASGSRETGKKPLPWILAGVAAVVVMAVAGWWWFLGRDAGTTEPPMAQAMPVAPVPTETPTPEPEAGLMSEQELIEQARAVAAAEIVKQEEALRQRLEQEFPTPTPIPPTWTPTNTATPTASPTATRVPPTATTIPTATPVPPTATPAVREGDIVTPGPGVKPPVAIQRPAPEYPRMARRYSDGGPVEGAVEAEALVGIDGRVEEVRILKVEGPKVGFAKATEDAVMQWRYKPATKLGVKVRMWVTIRVPFRSQ